MPAWPSGPRIRLHDPEGRLLDADVAEIHVKDPDGYAILVGHWGKREHEAWEKRLAKKGMKPATP